MSWNKSINLQDIKITDRLTKKLCIQFYTIGLVGIITPLTASLFIKAIPFALILSFVSTALYHTGKINLKLIVAFTTVYLLSFIIEAIGVYSGQIFGNYKYSESLGFKLFDTPIIIGINWLFLVYSTAAITEKLQTNVFFKIILASSAMLCYDLVLEQVAPKLNMWSWQNNMIPTQNYLAWFILAVIFHAFFKIMRIKIENRLAATMLISQFLFFLFIMIAHKLML